MLRELLYAHAPVDVARKRRVHFHSFMLEVQARIHARNQELLADKQELLEDRDAVHFVAHQLADQTHVLCFDEMQLTDVRPWRRLACVNDSH